MATIIDLVAAGELEKFDPELEPNELEHRFIYLHLSVLTRLTEELPQWESIWRVEQSPLQQLDALVEIFSSGESLTIGTRLKTLNHLGEGVWELKTPDLRLFGWFNVRDSFIITEIDLTHRVKMYNLYAGYAGQVVRKRTQLELNEPKSVLSTDPQHVVSSYNYP